jgi:hypothetical protein
MMVRKAKLASSRVALNTRFVATLEVPFMNCRPLTEPRVMVLQTQGGSEGGAHTHKREAVWTLVHGNAMYKKKKKT